MVIQGSKIKLEKTQPINIDRIIQFENSNSLFVHKYSKEKHLKLLVSNDCLHLSIKRLDNDKLIGHIVLFGLTNPNKVLEFRRITINEKGFGFGREAIKLIKQFCFDKLNYHRVWLDVYDDNEIAIKLYESEGFKFEGTLREGTKTDKGYRSQRIYSILEHEYYSNNSN